MSRSHRMYVESMRNGRELDHIAVCECGFESLPFTNRFDAVMAQCEVQQAEEVGQLRREQRGLPKSA